MSSQDISDADVQVVVDVLRSGRLALGPQTDAFEAALAAYVGVRHGVAVSSGTAALHLIVKALGLEPGAEVLVPSFTFASSVNVLLYEGLTPVFVDIEPVTYNLDPDDLARKVTPRTRAIMAVDVFGHPAEWDQIQSVAQCHGLRVIDDSCEALGAEFRGRKLGTFGDAAAFAFYPNKQMTTGEGGMIVTDDDELADLCVSLRNQGRGRGGGWLAHERLGYNYRLSDINCALGLSQLARLDEFVEARRRVARMYAERLAGEERLIVPAEPEGCRMSWFVFVVRLSDEYTGPLCAGAGHPHPRLFRPHSHPGLHQGALWRPARRPPRHRVRRPTHHRPPLPQRPHRSPGRRRRRRPGQEPITRE